MSEEQLLVTLGVKDSNCTSKVKELNKEIKSLDTIYKKTSETSKDFENSVEGLKTKLDYLSKKYDANKAKLSAYKEQMTKAKEMVAKKKEELEKLKNSEEQNAVAIQKAEKQLEKYQTQMNNANRNINETEAELKRLEEQIKDTNNSLSQNSASKFSENIEKLGDGLQSTGEKIENAGKKLSIFSAGVVALGKVSVDTYKEVKEGVDNLIKATGATGETAKKLKEVYNKLNEESKASFSEIGSALGEVNTRFGYTEEQAEKCTLSFLHFSDITGTDATKAVQLVSRAMGDAGINSEEYAEVLDNLALAAQASGISVDKLTENLTKYGAPMRALGFDMKESIALFSSWEKAGVNTEIAFSGMKKAISNWGSEGKDARKEFKKTLEEIKKCPDIAKATSKAIEVFGAKAGPDLADAIQCGRFAYEDFLNLLKNSSGTVEKTYNEINKDTEQNEIAMKNAKLALAELGQTIIKETAPIVKEVTELIKKAPDWFKNLDDDTKENIKTFLKISVVAGPIVVLIGKLTTGVGSLVKAGAKLTKGTSNLINKLKGIGSSATVAEGAISSTESTLASTAKTSSNLISSLKTLGECTVVTAPAWITLGSAVKAAKTITDLQNKTILETTDNMSLWERSINTLCNNGFNKSKKELQDMGLVYEDFNENVSEKFIEQVDKSADDVRDLALEIDKVNIDGIVTDVEKENLIKRVDTMCKEAVEKVKSYSSEGQEALLKMFNADGVLTDEEKNLANGATKKTQEIVNKINSLQNTTEKLINENSEKNKEQIQKNMEEVQTLTLDLLAQNEEEQANYRKNFYERARELDLKGIEEALTEYRANIDEKNKIIRDKYDEGIETAKKMADLTVGVDRDTWLKKIEENTKARDKELKQNEQFYDKFVDICIEGNEEAAKHINIISGKLMTKEEERSQQRLLNIKKSYTNIDDITKTGCYQLYNTTTGTLEKVAVVVDESTGKIAGVWESSSNSVGECVEGMGKEAQKLASEVQFASLSIQEANKLIASATVNSSNQVVDKNGNIISSLEGIKEGADGVVTASININNHPMFVKLNDNGTISLLDNIKQKVISLTDKTYTITMKMRQNWYSDGRGGVYVPEGYASGTNNATKGLHLVGEKGPELVYFNGGETVLNAEKTRNIITNGGYLNPNTIESTQLLNTSNVYNNNTYNNSNIDMNTLGNIIADAVTSAISSLSITMNAEKVAEIIDNQNGRSTAWERRWNGC